MQLKSYTDIKQSRKLAEILPLESVDMFYKAGNETQPTFRLHSYGHIMSDKDVCAWSLAALLGVLPEIQGGKPVIALDDNYITYPHMSDLHTKADNLVDACVAMIESLHELNLL